MVGKAIGGGVLFLFGLIVYQYLVVQKEETKTEMRDNRISFEKKELEFDKNMLIQKQILSEQMGNIKASEIYKQQADAIDSKIKEQEERKIAEAKRLEELKKQSEKILDSTNKTVEEQKKQQDFFR